jgi:hypothetical protein
MRDLVAAHADRYPALTSVMADPGRPVGSRWDFGLRCLLDGFAAAAARREDSR